MTHNEYLDAIANALTISEVRQLMSKCLLDEKQDMEYFQEIFDVGYWGKYQDIYYQNRDQLSQQ